MRPTSPTRVRLGILGVFALLAVGLVAPTVSGQFPRPQPQPQLPKLPGAGVPNFPGMPGNPGVGGPAMPGFPGVGGPGGVNPPVRPANPGGNLPGLGGPNIPGMGGPNIPGMPGGNGGLGGGGIFENVYYCKKCNVVLGRGAFPPASATCTGCGLTYNNGIAFDDGRPGKPGAGNMNMPGGLNMPAPILPPVNPGFPGGVNMPGNLPVVQPQPQFPAPGGNNQKPDLQPVFGNNPNGTPEKPPVAPIDFGTPTGTSTDTPSSSTPTVTKSSNKTLYIIGGIVLGLLVVLGMVVGVLYVKSTEKQTTRRKVGSKGRKILDDEDDD